MIEKAALFGAVAVITTWPETMIPLLIALLAFGGMVTGKGH